MVVMLKEFYPKINFKSEDRGKIICLIPWKKSRAYLQPKLSSISLLELVGKTPIV